LTRDARGLPYFIDEPGSRDRINRQGVDPS
jgi:hypothetical protein